VRALALLLALLALGVTLWYGLDERGTALAFGVLIAVGELARWSGTGERESAPLGAAGALAYALLGENAGHRTDHGVLQVVAVVVAAALIGCVPHVARGHGPTPDDLARRVLTVAFAAVCFQPLYDRGRLRPLFIYFHQAIGLQMRNQTPLATAPDHFQRQVIGQRPRGEDSHGCIPSKVPAAAGHLLALHGHCAAEQFGACFNAFGIGWQTAQGHCQAGGPAIIAVNQGRGVQAIDH